MRSNVCQSKVPNKAGSTRKSIDSNLQILYRSLHITVLVIIVTVVSLVIADRSPNDPNTASNALLLYHIVHLRLFNPHQTRCFSSTRDPSTPSPL